VRQKTATEPNVSLSDFTLGLQARLLSVAEDAVPGMEPRHRGLLLALEVLQAESCLPALHRGPGRPQASRVALLRSFLAKCWFNLDTTQKLRRELLLDECLRLLCGFRTRGDVPTEATFSRAFAEFSVSGVAERAHREVLERLLGASALVETVYRDATDVKARERPLEKARKLKGPRKKPGPRPKELRVPLEPTRMVRQLDQSVEEMLAELPKQCDIGAKKNSDGHNMYWIGFKLHLDVADGGLPLSALTTSASLHDSQVGIPLMRLTNSRVRPLYQVMDAGYIGQPIVDAALGLDQIAIVAPRARAGSPAVPLEPDRKRRMRERWQVEQVFSWLKERFGGRKIRVRGHAKVHFHLMCGVLCVLATVAQRL
jgi:hypothetical protein